MFGKAETVESARPKLGNLADPAGYRICVTLGTARGVVNRPETFVEIFDLLKYIERSVESRLIGKPVC